MKNLTNMSEINTSSIKEGTFAEAILKTYSPLNSLAKFKEKYAEKSFKIKVQIGNFMKEIPALSTESILVAIERANLAPPSKCRSGECGFCRSLLISGDIYVVPISDWRRAADKKFNYFHPCASYPITDLQIKVPRNVRE